MAHTKSKPTLTRKVYEINELEGVITGEMEEKHRDNFNRYARYLGNKVYEIAGIYSTDTRELFMMYVALREQIKFKTH